MQNNTLGVISADYDIYVVKVMIRSSTSETGKKRGLEWAEALTTCL
jgi:hypothetical protein